MTEPDLERWRERLAEWQRRRAVRREVRAALAARRQRELCESCEPGIPASLVRGAR